MRQEDINIDYKKLPRPEEIYKNRIARFDVFKVKGLFSDYANEELTKILKYSRKAYFKYGYRPEIDEYDAKAAIYTVRVRYTSRANGKNYPVEEWVSLRFVPGGGTPKGTGDMDLFKCGDTPVSEIVQQKLFDGDKLYLSRIISSSRLCGIKPVLKGAPDNIATRSAHAYTGTCFALMNKALWTSCLEHSLPYTYLVGIIYERVIEKSLTTLSASNDEYSIAFTHAHDTLGENSIARLDRSKYAHYVYAYPGYFLNTKELIDVIRSLVSKGRLSMRTIDYYLGVSDVRNMSDKNDQLIHKIGIMLSRKGNIRYSKMSCNELRETINEHVSDGPRLFITKVGDRIVSVNQFLDAFKNAR